MNKTFISVVIPTYNEAELIEETLAQFKKIQTPYEIIVSDASNRDETIIIARNYGQKNNLPLKILRSPLKGRAHQMNFGAKQAKGEILLFLHADTTLPKDALKEILRALKDDTIIGGCFKIEQSNKKIPYKCISLFSNFRSYVFKVFHGNQAIFITKKCFKEIQGYKTVPIMEDIEISKSMRKRGKVIVLKSKVIDSTRRIEKTGFLKSIWLYCYLQILYALGINPIKIAEIYYGKKNT